MLDTKYLYLLEPSCQSLFLKKRRGGGVFMCMFVHLYKYMLHMCGWPQVSDTLEQE